MTNKTTLQRLRLDPYFSKTIETNLNVWSHDQNSYEIKFEFYDHQCNKPIDLTGADMRILLDHSKSAPQIFPLEIESKVLGLAKFMIPDRIRGLRGKITAHIYADYPNRTHDFGSFTFYMQLSKIDKRMGNCLDKIYISEFEKALEEIKTYKGSVDDEISEMSQSIIDMQQQINDSDIVKKDIFDKEIATIKKDAQENSKRLDEVPSNILKMSKLAEASIKYIAHRGNHTQYPENSIGAFKSVRNHWGIESDTQVTSDGEWVIMHDATVDRTTDGTGRVSELTLEEIKNLKLKFTENWTNIDGKIPKGWDKVPTFEEYLKICKGKGKIPVIEIKKGIYTNENFDKFADIVKRNIAFDKIVIMSFDYNVLLEIRKRLDSTFILYLASVVDKQVINKVYNDFRYRCGVNISYTSDSVTIENISYAHSKNILFGVWTVPENEFNSMSNLGVDMITTDSESSELKYGKITVKKPFEMRSDSFVHSNSVVENANGTITIKLIVVEGTNNYGDTIGVLPDWAIPIKDMWGTAVIRTSDGVRHGTADISGRTFNATSDRAYPGTINVGRGWEVRDTWANIEMTYDLY